MSRRDSMRFEAKRNLGRWALILTMSRLTSRSSAWVMTAPSDSPSDQSCTSCEPSPCLYITGEQP